MEDAQYKSAKTGTGCAQTGDTQISGSKTGGFKTRGPQTWGILIIICQSNPLIRGRVMGQSWSLVLFIHILPKSSERDKPLSGCICIFKAPLVYNYLVQTCSLGFNVVLHKSHFLSFSSKNSLSDFKGKKCTANVSCLRAK